MLGQTDSKQLIQNYSYSYDRVELTDWMKQSLTLPPAPVTTPSVLYVQAPSILAPRTLMPAAYERK